MFYPSSRAGSEQKGMCRQHNRRHHNTNHHHYYWFTSYLTGRRHRIKLGNSLSSRSDLSFGVPGGLVLGPLLFTLYTTPLSNLVSGHAIPHHLYADDSQLYVSFSSGDTAAALNCLQSCFCPVLDVDK